MNMNMSTKSLPPILAALLGLVVQPTRGADAEVTALACPLFVPLAEEGWSETEVARLVAESYLETFRGREIDVMVLGCTHYPLLRGVIGAVLGDGIRLVDSAESTADETAGMLEERGLLANGEKATEHHFYVTDSSKRFEEVGSRFLGMPLARLEPAAGVQQGQEGPGRGRDGEREARGVRLRERCARGIVRVSLREREPCLPGRHHPLHDRRPRPALQRAAVRRRGQPGRGRVRL